MCWSAEISLNTFIFGVVCAIIVYALNVIPLYVIIIIMSFTSMQLLEYFVWTYIDDKKINKILSYIGLFLIFIQLFLINYLSPNKKNSRILLTAFFIILAVVIIIQFKNITFKMTKGENGHLVWHWLDLPTIWIVILLLFYVIPIIIKEEFISTLFIIISITTSLYYYYEYKTWGTVWCYISNIAWIFFILKSVFVLYSNGNRNTTLRIRLYK